MKKILKIILAFLFAGTISFQTFSQTSYRVRIDSLITDGCDDCYKISKLASQNYVIACAGYDSFATAGLVILIDSLGNIQWSKVYSFFPYTGWEIKKFNILPTSDSGFYFQYERKDNMYNTYETSNIIKVDKQGAIQHFKHSFDGNALHAFDMRFAAVEKNTNNLYSIVTTYHYDSFSDEPCCYRSFFVKLDTTLSVMFSMELSPRDPKNVAIEIYSGSIPEGFLIGGLGYNSDTTETIPSLIKLDTTGNLVWKKYYLGYPNNHNFIKCILQVDSSFYLLEEGNSQTRIRKIDFWGNTLFVKEIDQAHSFPNIYFSFSRMDAQNENSILISGLLNYAVPIMFEMDSSGNIIQSRIGLDSLYNNSFIDGDIGAFLYTRQEMFQPYFLFEREFLFENSCNFDTTTITISNGIIIDSASFHALATYPLFLFNDSTTSVFCTSVSIPICISTGIGTSIENQEFDFNISPNPTMGQFVISSEELGDKNSLIEIFNLLGAQIYSAGYNFKPQTINCKLSQGIYFVRLRDSEKQLTQKLVVE